VLDDEHLVDVGGGKQRAVLALLLLHANEVVPSDRLIDELWPEAPPPTAAKIVQVHVSRLRKALDGAGEGILLTKGRGYLLRVEPGELDRNRFRDLLDMGRAALAAGRLERADEALRAALALWRGPPLAEFAYDRFAQHEIAELEELRVGALEERIDADLALGRHDAVVPELEQLVRRHPRRERLRAQLMVALYRAGRQAEALDAYREARRTLAEELGLEPSPTLRQLERAILAHDPALEAPTPGERRERCLTRTILIAAAIGAVLAGSIVVGAAALTADNGGRSLHSVRPDSVGVIDPKTNEIVDQVPVGATLTRIASGREGVWVVSQHDNTVTHIDPRTKTALRTIAVRGPAVDVGIGGRAVWVLLSPDVSLGHKPARLARIDPRLNDVLRTIPVGVAPPAFVATGGGGSIVVANGSVWVVSQIEQLAVSKIDAGTNAVKAAFSVGRPDFGFNSNMAGAVPGSSGIASGFGSLWIGANSGVIRVNPTSTAVSAPIGLGAVVPTAIAVGEGAVWVASRPGFRCCPPETVGRGTLTRVDPRANSVDAAIPIGGQPAAVAVGAGAVWIADPGTRSVVRVDPDTYGVKRIPVGARPRGIAVGDGYVWVSVS
jgi:DNA-binding SARP family transcriptional activator/streptogramin lyase